MNRTLSWYSENARDFVDRTVGIDCRALYDRFLPRLPADARILDAGCGSGRDSRAFLDAGYDVHAMDAVQELVEKAGRLTGLDVEVCRFEEFHTEQAFDGIWACASLLHVPETELPDTMIHLALSLKVDGLFYTSFKYGSGETVRGPRSFTDMDENGLIRLDRQIQVLSLTDSWITEDQRLRRKGEKWMNAIWRKIA